MIQRTPSPAQPREMALLAAQVESAANRQVLASSAAASSLAYLTDEDGGKLNVL